jgi:hypothetical protein
MLEHHIMKMHGASGGKAPLIFMPALMMSFNQWRIMVENSGRAKMQYY